MPTFEENALLLEGVHPIFFITAQRIDPFDEYTPLLHELGGPSASGHAKQIDQGPFLFQQYQDELQILLRYTLPVYWAYILEYSLVISTAIAVGHISSTALAASALVSMTAGVTGFSVVQGFASALDTVLPSAWTSEHPEHVGLWTQRVFIVMALVLIPISVIYQHSEALFLYLKQDPEIASLAGLYLRWMILGLPAKGFNAIAKRYFQSQGLLGVPTKVFLVISPLNALLMYLLVWSPTPLRLGFVGAPIATVISTNIAALCFLLYAIRYSSKLGWHPICRRSFTRLPLVFLLGLAGVAQFASEWSWELMTLAASLLGPLYLEAQSVLEVSASTVSMLPLSLSLASAVRIGNLLGEQNASRARISSHCSLLLTLAFALINCAIFLVFRKSWGLLFNNDPDVISVVADVLPFAACLQIFDALTLCSGGILRASNKIVIGAFINISAYVVIGIPLGIWLAFWRDMNLYGLWTALAIALVYSAVVGAFLCLRTDWEMEAKRVLDQNSAEQTHLLEESESEGSRERTNDWSGPHHVYWERRFIDMLQ